MKCKIMILIILFPQIILAHNFGKIGNTFPIIEESFIAMMKRRMETLDMDKEKENMTKIARDRVENPVASEHIATTQNNRIFYFDPTYRLDQDAVLPCGKIIHKAGTSVNPLEYMNLDRRMFFIDGRKEDQIEWLISQLKETKNDNELLQNRVILIGGSVFKIKKQLEEDVADISEDVVYFDQDSELTTKFKINAVPAIAKQEGLRVRIEEIVIDSEGE